MKTAVIIPTYNEKDNIRELISKVFSIGLEGLHVIVVDDNSPDGTGKIVEEMRKTNAMIHHIHRGEKKGLGTAYQDGFRYAYEKGAEYFFEIDADFSHDWAIIPDFLEALGEADIVVGSRYVPGAKIENWDFSRRCVSYFGNIYARMVLGSPVKDLTTGYKCYKRKVIEQLNKKEINSIGYVFQIETTYHAQRSGFQIKEIPIIFSERRLGKSKFSLIIIWESFWKVLKLRFIKNK